MSAEISITIDGVRVAARGDWTVAAAIWNTMGIRGVRLALDGRARAPLCAMGVCQECLVCIDDVEAQRACMVMCEDGMRVRTCGGAR